MNYPELLDNIELQYDALLHICQKNGINPSIKDLLDAAIELEEIEKLKQNTHSDTV